MSAYPVYALQEHRLDNPRPLTEQVAADWNLRYYDTSVHTANTVLPRYAKNRLVSGNGAYSLLLISFN